MFTRKRTEYLFLTFLIDVNKEKTLESNFLKEERIWLKSAYTISTRASVENLPIELNSNDEDYYNAALRLLAADLQAEDDSVKNREENIMKIETKKSQCYMRLGELSVDKRRAVEWLGRCLKIKR